MTHPIYRVRAFKIEAPFTLRVEFDDNTQQVIDFRPVLAGSLFGPLRDVGIFDQVKIDSEVHIGLAKRRRLRSRHTPRLAPARPSLDRTCQAVAT